MRQPGAAGPAFPEGWRFDSSLGRIGHSAVGSGVSEPPGGLRAVSSCRPLHSLRCQCLACSFDESAADRQILLQELVVSHPVAALLHEAEHPPDGAPLRSRASVLTVAQALNDSLGAVLYFSHRHPSPLEGCLGFCAFLAIVGRLDLPKDVRGPLSSSIP